MSARQVLALCGAVLLAVCAWNVRAGEQGKGGTDPLAREEEKHLKRLATFDRIEELAKEHKNDQMLEKVKMLREKEQRRFDKAAERIKRGHGKGAGKGKAEEKGKAEDKGDKGKGGEKEKEEKGRHEEKEKEEKGKAEGGGKKEPAEGKAKSEEKEEGKTKHGKNR